MGVSMLKQEPDYSKQWDDLRSRIATFFGCWIGGFCIIALISSIIRGNAIYLFPLWAFAFFVSGARWSLFPCPRCKRQLFKPSAWSVNQLLGTCPHCGLKKWTNGA